MPNSIRIRPSIIRILDDDIERWEVYQHQVHRGPEYLHEQKTAGHYHYRPKQTIYDPRLDRVKVISPARLEALIGHDMVCFIHKERAYLSKTYSDDSKRITLHLKRLNRPLDGKPHRLRLKIKSVDLSSGAPRIVLDDFTEAPMKNAPAAAAVKRPSKCKLCSRKHKARGFCDAHFRAFHRGQINAAGEPVANQKKCDVCGKPLLRLAGNQKRHKSCASKKARSGPARNGG